MIATPSSSSHAAFATRDAFFYALPHAAVMILAPTLLEPRVPVFLAGPVLALLFSIMALFCVRFSAARWLAGLPVLWVVVFAIERRSMEVVDLGRAALIAGCVLSVAAMIALVLRRAWAGAVVALLTLLPFMLVEYMVLLGSAISG